MIGLYEAIGRSSERMLEAARGADWEALLAAEADCATLVEQIRSASGGPPLAGADLRRRQEIILRVLADDAEIRDRLMPRMAELDALLRGAGQRRLVQRTYGT